MKQLLFDIRCEWGTQGVAKLKDDCDVLIMVDVLSFSTCISMACNQGAQVIPAADAAAVQALGRQPGVQVAVERAQWQPDAAAICAAPAAMRSLTADARLVLPAPNDCVRALLALQQPLLVGCIRNAQAVASAAMRLGSTIGVVPVGECWEDASLRPAWEDLIGAGAVIHALRGERSPEAAVAEMAYLGVSGEIKERMAQTVSGRALYSQGFTEDVWLAAEANVDHLAPKLVAGSFVAQA